MKSVEIAQLGASSIKDGNTRWQCSLAAANDNDDVDALGELPVYQALGCTSMPWPKDDKGHAEAIVLRGVGGRKGVVVGGRDTRSAKVVGKMDPGDTVAHSTDPDQTAMVRLQGKKKSGSLVVKGKSGKHLMVLLDGENEKLQIMARGAVIEISENGDLSLNGKGGASLLLQGKDVVVNGNLKLPGMPPGMMLLAAPIAGPQVLIPSTSAPGSPSAGVLLPGTFQVVKNVGGYT